MATKMNTLLAQLDHAKEVSSKEMLSYIQLFKTKQGMFVGERKTYTPREGYPDKPSERSFKQVASTVDEQLTYMLDDSTPHTGALPRYLKLLFQKEATNSKGAYRVPLVVEGVTLGVLSAEELLRLKDVLTNDQLTEMIKNLPVRSDSVRWVESTDPDYKARNIFETEVSRSVDRIGEIKTEILKDPNIDPKNLPANYRATTNQVKVTYEIGDQTRQNFSGEYTQTQRALILSRKSVLLDAVVKALKEVNDVEAEASSLDVNATLNYIFGR